MTDKEVPSWLKYEEEKQVSVSQVRFQFSDLELLDMCCCTAGYSRLSAS
jgi:hypothetical protein